MWVIGYMLVRLMMLVFELVLRVQIRERVVQKCMGYLEMKFLWMFAGSG